MIRGRDRIADGDRNCHAVEDYEAAGEEDDRATTDPGVEDWP